MAKKYYFWDILPVNCRLVQFRASKHGFLLNKTERI